MNEPQLIRNDSPHQVSFAEGTNLATGKKAEVLGALEQTGTLETDAPVIEHSVSDVLLVAVPEAALEAPAPEQPTFQREVKEAHARVPNSLPEPAKAVFVPAPAVVASPAPAPATARVEPSYLAAAPVVASQNMLPMDFPARVINLKIESDKVRSKLEALQASIRN